MAEAAVSFMTSTWKLHPVASAVANWSHRAGINGMEGDYIRVEIQERVIAVHLGGWLPHYSHPHLGDCDHFLTESLFLSP